MWPIKTDDFFLESKPDSRTTTFYYNPVKSYKKFFNSTKFDIYPQAVFNVFGLAKINMGFAFRVIKRQKTLWLIKLFALGFDVTGHSAIAQVVFHADD